MTNNEERAYMQGSRMVWRSVLQQACMNLGYDDLEAKKANWILEREAAIAALREVCGEFGDNDWPDNLHLADIIQKHLARNLK